MFLHEIVFIIDGSPVHIERRPFNVLVYRLGFKYITEDRRITIMSTDSILL